MKFESQAAAPVPSTPSVQGQDQGPAREETVTVWGTSATLMNTSWDVIDLIPMVVDTSIMETGDGGP
eukprot:1143423-Prorocentrum_lima.AAC.1